MLFVVVILYAVSWLPLETFSMICFVFPEIRENFIYQSVEYNIFVGSYFACHWLSMAHSCVNPLIYCYMNDKFRSHLHDLVCKRNNKYSLYAVSSKSHQPNNHNYNHSHRHNLAETTAGTTVTITTMITTTTTTADMEEVMEIWRTILDLTQMDLLTVSFI